MTVSDEKYICEDIQGTITCSNGNNLDIVNAYYGRSLLNICPHGSVKPSTKTGCNSTEDILSIVKNKCQSQSNRTACTITPSNGLFNDDPCPGIYKYLNVGYTCANQGLCNS